MKKAYTKPVVVSMGRLPCVAAGVSKNVSDRRLKTDIARVGTTVLGLPLYEFSYIGSTERFTGVMADDVLGVMPQAVSRNKAGFYSVDYGMLCIEMTCAARLPAPMA